jgi:hypothetical protein
LKGRRHRTGESCNFNKKGETDRMEERTQREKKKKQQEIVSYMKEIICCSKNKILRKK